MDQGGQVHVIPAAPHEAITGHHPSYSKSVFFKGLRTVLGTGWVHGTLPSPHCRKVVELMTIDRYEGFHGVRIFLALHLFLTRCRTGRKENEKKKQEKIPGCHH
jgi:hypothetical protein